MAGSWTSFSYVRVPECLVASLVFALLSSYAVSGYYDRRLELMHQVSNREKVHFYEEVSHELRNVVHVLCTRLEALNDHLIPMTEQELQIIYEKAMHVSRLVEDIETASDEQIPWFRVSCHSFDLTEIVRDVAVDERLSGAKKRVSVRYLVPASYGIYVLGDRERIRQVLHNLLQNAIRHTPDGGSVTVEVRVDRIKQHAVTTVRDTGPGIPEEQMDRVFERSVQLHQGTRSGRSGLGLSIVKHLIMLQGGHVFVECDQAGGCRFTFTLPMSNPLDKRKEGE
ncbi:sensor histidine kinase [Paenibacillus turpanensis]|uniref:sensor histidine kinase n=1 Tax=Paenibacillus turpanensis TaxID=2689078 RepID=UPI00140C1182|nr:HAMP domain-containing sensor histidine kinase [Paenibacillus turpanensis]